MKMIDFIKRLLCRHKWTEELTLDFDRYKQCSKCGKVKK